MNDDALLAAVLRRFITLGWDGGCVLLQTREQMTMLEEAGLLTLDGDVTLNVEELRVCQHVLDRARNDAQGEQVPLTGQPLAPA